MRKISLSAAVSCLLISSLVYGIGGDMGVGTEPLTNGSEAYPYLIEDFADFQVFADPCNSATYWTDGVHTRLECDLDLDPALSGRETYITAVIAPDTSTSPGLQGTSFTGVFDGNGHVISNLTIDTEGAGNDYLGLFGKIEGSGAEVKNLGIADWNIIGGNSSWYLGGLCGKNDYGTISNCYATGAVTGGDDSGYFGGLCGYNTSYGTISNCYSTGAVTGGNNSDSLGGLCGENGGSISDCYSTGAVTGGDDSDSLGGLCGGNGGSISSCYATGAITGGDYSGGLGGLCGFNGGSISDCYATGAVIGEDDSYYLGGLCGHNDYDIISNCYFLDPIDGGGPDNGVGTPLTDAQMRQQANFANWDFTDETANGTSQIWEMPTGGGYPELSSFSGYIPVVLSGDGSQTSPYLISNAAELGAIYHYSSNACFRLQSDINLIGIQWSTAVVPVFVGGCFDGNGYAIYNLTIEGGGYLGLFGQLKGSGAEVKNLGLENINITGGNSSWYLGGLCGENFYGTISNCYATGAVTGGDDSYNLGGLCGENNRGTITNCYSSCSITGGNSSCYLGGLCGYNYRGTISSCYATGAVTGGNDSGDIGGLCGYNYVGTISNCYATGAVTGGNDSGDIGGLCGENDTGSISNCYATGAVTGGDDSYNLGGLCGYNGYSSTSIISNSYSSGSVTVTGGDDSDYLGGLCGENYGIISNCYFLDPIDGGGPDNGVGTPLTDAQMRQQANFANWDFTDETANGTSQIWEMPTGGGYPELSSFSGYIPVVLSGDGSQTSPYLISNAAELGAIYHYSSNACFRLQSDINLIGIQWSTAVVPVFVGGCFDGNGYAIYNLTIEGGGYLGLFGQLKGSSAEVKNLGLENINITGENSSCYLGGLCGENFYGTISNSYATGAVTGGDDSGGLGGLCGKNDGTISNCYSSGSVTCGDDYAGSLGGGLCGFNDGTISNCYATGAVTGGNSSWYLGGLCGYNYVGTISNCYAIGEVTGGNDSDRIGGLCGYQYGHNAEISNCFWDTQTSGMTVGYNLDADHPGTITNVVGKTTAEMQTESTFTDASWDFAGETANGTEDIWTINEGLEYPRLFWQLVYFADPNLQTAVEDELGVLLPTVADMFGLTFLNAEGRGIVDLTGLEYALNVASLYVDDNQIHEIFPISQLTNLAELWLEDNTLNTAAYCEYLPQILADNPGIDLRYDPNPNPLTDDCSISEEELVEFSGHWLDDGCGEENNWCGGADLNYSGDVGLDDFAELVKYWME